MTQLLTTATVRRVVRVAHTLALVAGVAFVARHDAAAQAPLPKPPARVAANASGLPPIIDRELLFGNPEITGAELSPDGTYLAFLKPYKDTRNVWVKKTSEPFSTARLVTADTKRPIPGFFWSRDSRYILFVQDNAGDENYNVYAVNPADQPAAGQDAPPARNLTDAKGARALIYAVPKAMPDVIFVGLNDRDASWHDLYKVTLSTGARELIKKNTEKIAQWVFNEQGELKLAARTTDAGDTELLQVTADGFKTVYTCTVFESCGPVRFHKDGERVYLDTNKGEANDLGRLTLFDPASGSETLVESDPMKRVDFGQATFSDVTNDLLFTSYDDERARVYFKDKALEADYKVLQGKLSGKDIHFVSRTADEQLWVVAANSDVEPGETYLFDRRTKKLTLQYRIREKLPRESLTHVTAVHYPSSDGLDIPAYLTLPKGLPAKNLPLIVFPHGGPWARDSWSYSGIAQFLSNRGYAVLQPNFRGSTGYGKKFLNAGNKEWGDKMQDDLTWGVKYLVAQGTVDAKRVGIMGGSYGGYATLAGVAFTPDVYSGAVAIVAPSNLITLLDSIPPYWESGRKIFHTRMGDPTTPEGKKQLERQSPLNSADKIKTPLLVVQGANDPRVKRAEADQIVIALRDRGFPVEYLVAPDEGHGFQRPVNNMAMFASAEAFLAKHLGGRYQEGGTPEVTARLKEITVDPKTVVLAKKLDPAAVGLPKPSVDLKTGTSKYKADVNAGGQTFSMAVTQTIVEQNGDIVATEVAATPMGDVSDTSTLQKGTLVLRKRSIKQGPMAIELSFDDAKASGTMAMGGPAKPVSADLGGPLFGDGAGAFSVLATLPLADGYTATFRNFDVQKQKASLKQLKVVGAEDVKVPAGTFKTWKAEIASAEGDAGTTTIWVAQDTHQLVRMTATLPQMGGATLTSELQP
jgi:dipeptidyl aminopeptidase/acylaminoacyl peptidase